MIMASVIFEEQVEVPLEIHSLDDFRRWTRSDDFPQTGRIDWIDGRIEVDMTPEAFYTHGGVKTEIAGVLWQLVKENDLGELYIDRARIASVPAALSSEPDMIFTSHETLDSGAVRFIAKQGRDDDVIEMEGGPDMVVEIVSDGSVGKDTRRLPVAYYKAGVREFWLVDARQDELLFQIHGRGDSGFKPAEADAEGFQHSAVFSRGFKLLRERDRRGHWKYDMLIA